MIDAVRLRAVLDYSKETGEFRWREKRGRVYAGQCAGSPHKDGYIQIKIDRKLYKAHRLAWLYIFGDWPKGRLDHADNRHDNNRIANLRPATHAQNMANRKLNRNSASGVKGVSFRYGRYRAYINANGKRHWLGNFAAIEDAIAARDTAAKELHGEFARAA